MPALNIDVEGAELLVLNIEAEGAELLVLNIDEEGAELLVLNIDEEGAELLVLNIDELPELPEFHPELPELPEFQPELPELPLFHPLELCPLLSSPPRIELRFLLPVLPPFRLNVRIYFKGDFFNRGLRQTIYH